MTKKLIDSQYTNTGGGSMVATQQWYISDINQTVFVHCNEDGCSLATCDYIIEDIDYDGAMTLEMFDCHQPDTTSDYIDLYRSCMMYFISKAGYRAYLPAASIPTEFFSDITQDYIAWHLENIGDDYATDGRTVFQDDRYEIDHPILVAYPDDESVLQAKDMLTYMHDDLMTKHDSDDIEDITIFNNTQVTIIVGRKVFTTAMCAAAFNAVETALKEYLNEQ